MEEHNIDSRLMHDLNKEHIGTPITADTFNDIWNAIECIDYRLRDVERINQRYKIALIIIALVQIMLLIILSIK